VKTKGKKQNAGIIILASYLIKK